MLGRGLTQNAYFEKCVDTLIMDNCKLNDQLEIFASSIKHVKFDSISFKNNEIKETKIEWITYIVQNRVKGLKSYKQLAFYLDGNEIKNALSVFAESITEYPIMTKLSLRNANLPAKWLPEFCKALVRIYFYSLVLAHTRSKRTISLRSWISARINYSEVVILWRLTHLFASFPGLN